MRAAFVIPLLIAAASQAQPPSAQPAMSPNDLVRKVVANEIKADNQDQSHWMFQVVTNLPAPSKTQAVVETKNGNITYLEDINGHPLTPQQRTREDQRVQQFVMGNQPAGILNQIAQHCKGLGRHIDRRVAAQKTLVCRVQPKTIELLHSDWTSGKNQRLAGKRPARALISN